MAERRTLAQLRSERARRGNSLNVEVVGVVVALEKLEASFKGLAGRNKDAEGNARRAVWIADNSGGAGQVLAAKTFLWKERAVELGDQLEQMAPPHTLHWQDLGAGRVTVLAVSPVDISDINRGQLGTKKAGGTTYKLDPAPEGELAELAEPLGDAALAQQLRDWFSGAGVADAAAAAVAAGKRLIRAKGNPETNPDKLGAFGSAAVGEPAPKKRAAPGAGAKGAKKQKAAA
ncbi:non-ribosomal peptide synthetase [Chlorella sorokiniana]|uniref:Non-ribosomal peptide synthetase n=1 Tax=Chlorella sorokiniana TaxID=3076 RepID=A0A2P6TCC7_CHLSO|nr:non-ribosomal peptide synthetase [Chlorella sorokiniana]|eukprot:PRW20278.1 non-ribosomal peptide synthetase [Chlorella sorokiniana]